MSLGDAIVVLTAEVNFATAKAAMNRNQVATAAALQSVCRPVCFHFTISAVICGRTVLIIAAAGLAGA